MNNTETKTSTTEVYSDEYLNELYQEFCQWREEHPDSIYVVFDASITYSGLPLNRYVVAKGVELYKFFGDVIIQTISGEETLHQPITCASVREATELCRKLNSKYVHDNEPQTFANCPTWQEAYEKYHGTGKNEIKNPNK